MITCEEAQNRITVRSVGWPATYRTPSRMSVMRCGRAARGAGRSGRRTRRSAAEETANVIASMAIVEAGPMAAERMPASAGPAIQPTVKNVSKIALARAIWGRPTRPGTAAV